MRKLVRMNLVFLVVCSIGMGSLAMVAHSASSPTPISECQNEVSGDAVLVQDLDCRNASRYGIKISGDLDLNGHTITGHSGIFGIVCLSQCTISGPGTITGALIGVSSTNKRITLIDVTITRSAESGVESNSNVRIFGGEISFNEGRGVAAGAKVSVFGGTRFEENGIGMNPSIVQGPVLRGIIVRVRDALFLNNHHGVASSSRRIFFRTTTVSGNRPVSGFQPERRNLLRSKRIKIIDSHITGNLLGDDSCAVVDRQRGLLIKGDSSVSGNCGDSESCYDVCAMRSPNVRSPATCGKSIRTEDPREPFGVCTDD